MIDLRFNTLPSTLEVGGSFFRVHTDFRIWLQFGEYFNNRTPWDGIFVEAPNADPDDWLPAALEFYKSENVTPRSSETISDRIIDYILDGDYIVASFQAVYGIDLTDSTLEMHWHRFKALLVGLPDNCKLTKIMSYRAYAKKPYDHDKEMRKLKEAWALPDEQAETEKDAVLQWAEEFFGE